MYQAIEQQVGVQAWCEEHLGRRLPITCVKDHRMVEIWDDRSVQVVPNTGECAVQVAIDGILTAIIQPQTTEKHP